MNSDRRRCAHRGAPAGVLRCLFVAFAGGALILTAFAPGLYGQSSGATPQKKKIVLESITFPERTDLSGETTTPPEGAPLGQQVVFHFSGPPEVPGEVVVDGPPGYGALQIYAVPGPDYTGPRCVVDPNTGTIPARGVYERLGKKVVFTPYFPVEPIDLTYNAEIAAVPGLLPDMEYTVFVPLGTGEAIPNLGAIRPGVVNPVSFTTISAGLPNLFYRNQPSRPPRVVESNPADGDTDVPVNTLSGSVPGFPPEEEFYLSFDQPLHYSPANISGRDIDGDGVREPNMYFLYWAPEVYAALDETPGADPAIVLIDRRTGADAMVGVTRLAAAPHAKVGLKSIAVKRDGVMLGSSGDVLYTVEYKNLANPGVCRLADPRPFGGLTTVRGLAPAPGGGLFALDAATGDILAVDEETGAVEVKVQLGTAYGETMDLAVRADGRAFVTAVKGPGQPGATTTLLGVDLAAGAVRTIWSGAGDFTAVAAAGFGRLALYSAPGLEVRLFDLDTMQFLPSGGYVIAGNAVPAGAPLDTWNSNAELGVRSRLASNSYHGARVVLAPTGILPFGERVEIMIRRGLSNISFGSIARNQGKDPAEADRAAAFVTFDPGSAPVDDVFVEDFLDNGMEANFLEYGALPPAEWNVQDTDGVPPQYEHLLAAYGLSGRGGLGDFVPTGVFPTIYLNTDRQELPLPDGSTPGVTKPTVVEGGVFDFHDIVIPKGVTVVGWGSHPLVLTATGKVDVAGVIDVSGEPGASDMTFNAAFVPTLGGRGGPGGGRGGVSQPQMPPDFKELTDLRSPAKGEDGWGYGDLVQNGGRGGSCGAKGTDVKYKGGNSGEDPGSRGSGGGGGSFLQEGGKGFHGLGKFGADPFDPDRYFERGLWWWYDGNPQPVPGRDYYQTQAPPGGAPGEKAFKDSRPENDYIGPNGEVPFLRGGEGGGGAGSRLDSMNPETINLAAQWTPPVDRSAYDAKGGGGGGGGGALGLYSLGEITIRSSCEILARGGDGGGGEAIGHANYGGGGGGGSGGAVILDSAVKIHIESGALVDVSGGWPGEAKEVTRYSTQPLKGNPCLNPLSSGGYQNFHKASFCAWSVGDGGFGGYGLVQLQVPDWTKDLVVDDWESVTARLCEVDWLGPDGLCDYSLNQTHCGCASSTQCARKFFHYKVNYPMPEHPEFPLLHPDPAGGKWDPLIDPARTRSNVGSLSYGLSQWIDMGQTIHRDPVGGVPAPCFLGFVGIDSSGVVITQNGHIPNPGLNDIEVDAPDLGLADYIPDENEVAILFQGAGALTPGSPIPDPASKTAWTADIASLSGKQFVRFRVRLDTAKGVPLQATNPKPQVNMVRIRVRY